MIYVVRDKDDAGPVLGEVTGDTYIDAAREAAKVYFQLPAVFRASGWAGHPGNFFACGKDLVNLERAIPFHLRAQV